MKKTLIAITIALFVFALVRADIGPSPSYSFDLSNQDDFPEYSFYYAGNLWEGTLNKVSARENSVYKLDTTITLYAVKNSDLTGIEEKQSLEKSVLESKGITYLASNAIQLEAGKNIKINVSELNESEGTMKAEKAGYHVVPGPEDVVIFNPLLLTQMVLLIAFIAIIAFALYFIVKKTRQPKKPKM